MTSASSMILTTCSLPQYFNKFVLAPLFFSTKLEFSSRKILSSENLSKNQFLRNVIYQDIENEYESEEEYGSNSSAEENEGSAATVGKGSSPLLMRTRRRYRKQYPGEKKGITEEMRFIAMKLRNDGKSKGKKEPVEINGENDDKSGESETWQPTMEGFLKYLVDTELVFRTVERIVDESTDVSYVYFRKTGLERSGGILRDLEWFREQGNEIPEPSNPGITYVQYLKELAEKSPPLFLCHFYNIYFSHIAGGQVIAKQVSETLLEGREMELYRWDGDAEDLLRGVRENLNALAEHWTRDIKNKCLREATKAFRFLGQIVRLIIL